MSKKEFPKEVETMRHSSAHLMAAAVAELYPEAKFGVGPVVENGFYYDLDLPVQLRPADLQKIESKMRQIQKRNEKFIRREMPLDEAIQYFKEHCQIYKVELLKDIKTKGTTRVSADESFDIDPEATNKVSVYETGKFIDLCRGPHVKSTKDVGVFKLTKLAGAYWRGSEKNKMLQRIYGVAFTTQAELDDYFKMLEDAEKRDHRRIGQAQELFFFDDMVGKGLPIWLPNGTIIKNEIEKLAVEMENQAGYERVTTPHLGKKELYETSGHLPYYADSMYPAMEMDDGTYYLKSMNCPHHHLIYKSKPRSYRDLPLRLAEYGTVYRNELSGTLAGLLRVRMLSMNDAHIYCRQDQVEKEFAEVLKMTIFYFNIFGLKDYWFRLSKWDPKRKDKYIDEPENWKLAENSIRSVLKKLKVSFVEAIDEAAFYGPKVDAQFKSVIGREESMSTIQMDFAAKKRFHLSYVNSKGEDDESVFVIHRAPLSTHERFMAFLIEHYAGAFPLWLSPVQVAIVPVGENHIKSCRALALRLTAHGIRLNLDESNETVGYKIRKAEQQKVPYMLVIGDKECPKGKKWQGSTKLAVRVRGKKELVNVTLDKFFGNLEKMISERSALDTIL